VFPIHKQKTPFVMTGAPITETTMTTTRTPKPKRHYFEAYKGGDANWYVRQVASNKSKIAASEGYVGGRAGVLRSAQSTVNGFAIPVARLNIVDRDAKLVLESWVLRPRQKAERIDVNQQTPEV
jgi:uncharacterized protein YegP (UPF0339 family)